MYENYFYNKMNCAELRYSLHFPDTGQSAFLCVRTPDPGEPGSANSLESLLRPTKPNTSMIFSRNSRQEFHIAVFRVISSVGGGKT